MTKELYLDPAQIRARGTSAFKDIPLNNYQKKMKDVLGEFTSEELINIFFDMLTIREFETMMQDLRLTGKYCDMAYNYSGPAHLGIGQESVAVGQAFLLDCNDAVFGTHRSHGELIAKGFSALRKLTDRELEEIMERSNGGAQYLSLIHI